MKKIRILILTACIGLTSFLGAIVIGNIRNNVLDIKGAASTYTLTIDSKNFVSPKEYGEEESQNINTTLNNPIKITCYYCMPTTEPGYHFQMKKNKGYLYNYSAISEIQSIKVNYKSNTKIKLFYGTSKNPSTNVTSISNGTAINIPSGINFFKIAAAGNAAYIKDVEIKYICQAIPVDPTDITLDKSEVELTNKGSKTLQVTYTPENANRNKELTFTSSDENVATVDTKGKITISNTANVGDTCTITAKLTNIPTISKQCKVTVVEEKPLEKTKLNYTYKDYYNNGYYDDIDCCPSVGNPKVLVIPIWFNDSSTYITNTTKKNQVKADIASAYGGTASETGWHSVSSFYYEESKGKLNLQCTVSDWYSCGYSSTYFYKEKAGLNATCSLVTTATNWYFTNNPSDSRTNYDYDGNGYLDGVLLIYGSPDTQALGNPTTTDDGNMWAYCFWLQDKSLKNITNPGPNTFFWASYDFMYGSSTASSRAGSSYSNGDTSYCSIDSHTFTHEMGHVLGLDDYYDYSNSYTPAGSFSMQDYNVGGHDPYSVMALGWADPYIPTESCVIELNPFQSSHDIILLTPEFNSYSSPFDEYFLLELYTPTGLNKFDSDHAYKSGGSTYPSGPSNTGIRLWHVDARLVHSTTEEFTANWTSDVNVGNVIHGMSNSYNTTYGSPLGSSYLNYNLLQLIRRNTTDTYKPTADIRTSDLFINGTSFNFSTYSKQFVKGSSGTLNNGSALGWTFDVAISGTGSSAVASITLNKVS